MVLRDVFYGLPKPPAPAYHITKVVQDFESVLLTHTREKGFVPHHYWIAKIHQLWTLSKVHRGMNHWYNWTGHFRVAFLPLHQNESKWETIHMKMSSPSASFSCKSNLVSKQRSCTRTRFEAETQGNSEMAFLFDRSWHELSPLEFVNLWRYRSIHVHHCLINYWNCKRET